MYVTLLKSIYACIQVSGILVVKNSFKLINQIFPLLVLKCLLVLNLTLFSLYSINFACILIQSWIVDKNV
jgi:hypothetical protein